MMRIQAVIALFPDLQEGELLAWIEQRWVQPDRSLDEEPIFHDIDIARVQMIYDLRHRLEVHEETMPLVLSLVDQVYELRRNLKAMSRALEEQPDDIRSAILRAIGESSAK